MSLIASPDAFWYTYLNHTLPLPAPIIWSCNTSPRDIKKMYRKEQELIWVQIWLEWSKINYCEQPKSIPNVLNQSIWYNSLIKLGGKYLHNDSMIAAGIIKIKNMYNSHENRFISYRELCN